MPSNRGNNSIPLSADLDINERNLRKTSAQAAEIIARELKKVNKDAANATSSSTRTIKQDVRATGAEIKRVFSGGAFKNIFQALSKDSEKTKQTIGQILTEEEKALRTSAEVQKILARNKKQTNREAVVDSIKQSVGQIGTTTKGVLTQTGNQISNFASKIGSTIKQYWSNSLVGEGITKAINKIIEKYKELGQTAKESNKEQKNSTDLSKLSLQELQERLKSATERYDKLKQTVEWYETASEQSGQYRFSNVDMQGALATTSAKTKEAFADTEEEIKRLNEQIKNYGEKVNETSDAEEEAGKQGTSAFRSVGNSIRAVAKSTAQIIAVFRKIFRTGVKVAKSIIQHWKKVINTFKKAAITIGQLAGTLAKISTGTLRSNKAFDVNGKSLKKMVQLFSKYVFGFRSFFFLYRRIRKAVKEGLESLALVDTRTNTSISNILTALNTLRGSLASAFSPIINVVAPIIVKFCNMLATATNYVGMFIAAITGQKTYYKAASLQQDYAESLQDTAGAAKDASDAMKDYLSGLDEIRKWEDDKSSGSGSGSGGGGKDPTQGLTWEEVEIPTSIKNLADKIKAYFRDEDWEGLGSFAAEQVNKFFTKLYNGLKSDAVQEKVEKFADAFATVINAFVGDTDWETVGKTVGAALNTITKGLGKFINKLNTYNIGTGIGDIINGFFTEVNWTQLGKTLGTYFNKFWQLLKGAAKKIKWANVGSSIAKAINGFFKKYKFSTTTGAIVTFINGLFTAFGKIVKKVKWKDIAQNITSGINKFIKEFKWKKNGGVLGEFAQTLFTSLTEIFKGIKWKNLGSGVASAINGFFKKYKFSSTSTAITSFINSLFEALGEFTATLEWEDIANNIVEGFNSFIKDFKWKENGTKLNDFLQNLMDTLGTLAKDGDWEGLGEGIADFLASIEWGKLLDKAAEAILTALGGLFKGFASKPEGVVVTTVIGGIAALFTAQSVLPIVSALATALGSTAAIGILGPAIVGAVAAGAALYAGQQYMVAGYSSDVEDRISQISADMGYDAAKRAREIALADLEDTQSKIEAINAELNDPNNPIYNDPTGGAVQAKYTELAGYQQRLETINQELAMYNAIMEDNADAWALANLRTRKQFVNIEKAGNLKKYGSANEFVKSMDPHDEKQRIISEPVDVDPYDKLKTHGSPQAYAKSLDPHGEKGIIKEKIDVKKAGKLKEETDVRGVFQKYYMGKQLYEKVDAAKGGHLKDQKTVRGMFAKYWMGGDLFKAVDAARGGDLKAKQTVAKVITDKWMGGLVSKAVGLGKDGWETVKSFVDANTGETVTKTVTLDTNTDAFELKIQNAAQNALNKGLNATVKAGTGAILPFAKGGIVPHYASGSSKAHGTVFVAGESGPEIMGHVNGKTEILNQSQIVAALYGAVSAGIATALNMFANALFGQMNFNTNLILGAIYKFNETTIPAIAMGSALPANNKFISAMSNSGLVGGMSESGLRQLIREESNANTSYEFVAQLNRKTIFDEVIREGKLRQIQTGKNPFEFA